MSDPTVIVYKAPASQTALAVKAEFPTLAFEADSRSFEAIRDCVQQDGIAVLPMWNSHKGELRISYALRLLFEKNVRLLRIWPQPIIFHCLVRSSDPEIKIGSIVSVTVAKEQCSRFLATHSPKFIESPSTTDAYEKFRVDVTIDAVLCTPEQDVGEFRVLTKESSNSRNVTTFGLIGHPETKNWSTNAWGSLESSLFPQIVTFFGIQMPLIAASTALSQDDLFDQLTADVKSLNDVPKILFVTRRDEDDTCGLLIESNTDLGPPEIISLDGGSADDVRVLPDLGGSSFSYHDRIRTFIEESLHDELAGRDFLRFRGIDTCFYACPALGIITHGFEERIVEPVVRRMIARSFRLFGNGVPCTAEQRRMFERHQPAYFDKGFDFVEFFDLA